MPPPTPARKRGGARRAVLLWQAIVAVMLQLALAVPAMAAPTHIAASLMAEGPAQAGGTVQLALLMQPGEGWHGYWQNPGDAGLGMSVEATLGGQPVKLVPLRYPVPQVLLVNGLMNHVYEHDYAVLTGVTLPAALPAGTALPLRIKAQWLACTREVCVPEQAELNAKVTVGSPGAPDARFDQWRAALPAPLGSTATFALAGNTLRIAIPLPRAVVLEAPHLFVADDHLVDYAAPQVLRRTADRLVVELPRAKFAALEPTAFSAVLRLNRAGDGVTVEARPGAVPSGGEVLREAGSQPPALGWLLAAALLGGLLLNVMPCVFPILSLKALSLARAGESEAQARAEGLAYSAGVIAATLALGGLMLALRAAGQEVGWAFQLQEPLVVAGLALLAVAITANLLGLYEVAVPGFASEGSPQGAFATGLLAAFAATPCTGPFMAAAMGAALLMPWLPALLLFAMLGLGLALPFLALAYVPALRRLLPRPGAWMVWFRKAMALPMGLTAMALVWLASRLAGPAFALSLALLAFLLVVIVWVLGRRQRHGLASARLFVPALLALIAAAALGLPTVERAPSAEAAGVLPSQPFSEAALAKARASGKPVFAYFTADWCLTCKVNEAAAIEREPTRAAFAKAGVTVLRGDWTRRDPAITRFLSAQGAAGVPLYLWYPAGGGAPQQLQQVLGPDTLVELAR